MIFPAYYISITSCGTLNKTYLLYEICLKNEVYKTNAKKTNLDTIKKEYPNINIGYS